jgi:hypothetical protein
MSHEDKRLAISIKNQCTDKQVENNTNIYKLPLVSKSTFEGASSIIRRPWEAKRDRTNFICWGSFSAVFRSSINGEKVAVKRVEVDSLTPFHEKVEKVLGQLDHPNVIKLLQVTQNVDYRSVDLIVQLRLSSLLI